MLFLFNSLFNKKLLYMLLAWVAAPVVAHSYFFGFTEINLNNNTKNIEVIHQFTAHDIENTIAEIKQINFSPEHASYDQYIQDYFEKHFLLKRDTKKIHLNWIGFEIKRGQIIAYQESGNQNFLTNLVVKNTILIDTYAKQINTVNYQDLSSTNNAHGSLTFDSSIRIIHITSSKLNINKK